MQPEYVDWQRCSSVYADQYYVRLVITKHFKQTYTKTYRASSGLYQNLYGPIFVNYGADGIVYTVYRRTPGGNYETIEFPDYQI